MSEQTVSLTFPAKADYLLLARLTLSGLARHLPVDDEMLADLKLAVTEACGNAVRHAYEDERGAVGVLFAVKDGRLEMIVEDQGGGIAEGPLRTSYRATGRRDGHVHHPRHRRRAGHPRGRRRARHGRPHDEVPAGDLVSRRLELLECGRERVGDR